MNEKKKNMVNGLFYQKEILSAYMENGLVGVVWRPFIVALERSICDRAKVRETGNNCEEGGKLEFMKQESPNQLCWLATHKG